MLPLICIAAICFLLWLTTSALSRDNPLGALVGLGFAGIWVFILFHYLDEQSQFRKFRKEEERKANELARQERARRRWENSPAGQECLKLERREREEKERLEALQREQELAEAERERKAHEELLARIAWHEFHQSKSIAEIETMSGVDFERLLGRLLTRMGFTNVSLTPINDQGGDLIGDSPKGARTVVQAKRWKTPLGNAVVQEILGAMLHYDCKAGLIITNSTFTAAAQQLASRDHRITLCDGRWLAKQLRQHLPAVVPEFNWEDYNKYVKDALPTLPAQRVRRTKASASAKPRYRKRRRWRRW